jgi:predicted nuclease with TOPRIM domain
MADTTDIEKKNLEAHVELCAERYSHLDSKLRDIDEKISSLDAMVKEVHDCVYALNNKFTERIIAWAGSLIVILLGVVGWLATQYIKTL